MSNWAEIAKGYSFQVTVEGVKGKKVYRTSSTGTITDANLPQINITPFTTKGGTTYSDCVAVSMTETHTDAQAGNDAFQDRTYDFETPGMGGDNGKNQTSESAEKNLRFTVGGEFETIEDPAGAWIWDGTSDSVDVPIYRRIGTGSIIRSVYGITESELDGYLALLSENAGTINTDNPSALWGFDEGQLLFNGASGYTEYDPDTEEHIYNFDLEFIYKVIGVGGDDWNYILDEDTGTYKKPVTSPGNQPLYQSFNLEELFSA